jgi:hypothetical protein
METILSSLPATAAAVSIAKNRIRRTFFIVEAPYPPPQLKMSS